MTGRRGPESEGVPGDSGAGDPPRGPQHRVAALTLAFLLVLGGLMGSINLFVDDVLRAGPQRWLYGATMAACIAAALPLVVRQRVNRRPTYFLRAFAVLLSLAFWIASTSCFFFIAERPEMSSFLASASR
jgi:hypothetical protein